MSPKPDLVYQRTAYSHNFVNLLDDSFPFFYFFLTRIFNVDLLFYITFQDDFFISVCIGPITIDTLWLRKGKY